ncbi:hypothetical protein SAMN05444162_3918 [Paenibacillaceae bacterium GAS479]|nr:hypothetical protein SAMN05444162_3918 [Paenibacillaceae bacterium GAS479]
MRRSPLKWTIVGAALAAVLLFGMEMTAGGISRVYGPVEGSEPAKVTRYAEAARELELQKAELQQLKYEAELKRLQSKYGIASGEKEPAVEAFLGDEESAYSSKGGSSDLEGEAADSYQSSGYSTRLPGIEDPAGETGVNRLADGTAGMLQSVSSSGIRFIVTLFDSMTQ